MELTTIILFVITYFGLFTALSYKFSNGYSNTKPGFLVANRTAGLWESGLAAGASWVLGLALFASSKFGYNMGWAGLIWFIVPQTLSLFIFAWFSNACNERITNGYTLSGWIKKQYGTSVSMIYQIVLSLVSLGFISLTFTALVKFLTFMGITNVPLITGIVVIGTLTYALIGGLKTNLITGSLQMIFMLAFCAILLVLGLTNGGYEHLITGINGKENYENLFDPKLLTTFGLVMFLTSITGIVGNQAYYQKSFGQQLTNHSAKSFIIGGITFAMVPTMLGLLGIMAFGSGVEIKDATTAHLSWMQTNLGIIAVLAFGFIVLNCAANSLDTSGNAFGAIIANDLIKDETKSVLWSRIAIIGIAIAGWSISVLNLDLTYIFLTYGVLRITLFVITILAVKTTWLSSRGIFWSTIIIAPIAFYLNIQNIKLEAAILAFFGTPLLALVTSKFLKNDPK